MVNPGTACYIRIKPVLNAKAFIFLAAQAGVEIKYNGNTVEIVARWHFSIYDGANQQESYYGWPAKQRAL